MAAATKAYSARDAYIEIDGHRFMVENCEIQIRTDFAGSSYMDWVLTGRSITVPQVTCGKIVSLTYSDKPQETPTLIPGGDVTEITIADLRDLLSDCDDHRKVYMTENKWVYLG